MVGRVQVEIEVSRVDAPPRAVQVSAPADASVGAVLDVVGAQLGLVNAAGAVQARSLVGGQWLDRSALLREIGLLRGERLSVVVGLSPGSRPAPLGRWPERRAPDATGRVPVNRPPRPVRGEPSAAVTVPSRHRSRPPRRFPLGAMLIPLLIGGLLVVVTRRWEIALFSIFTPVMVAWNYVEERRAHRDEVREYGRTYDAEMAALRAEVAATTADWSQWLRRHHPAPAEVLEIARRLSPRLWERQPGDPDHLRVRLGCATRRSPVTHRGPEGGADLDDEDLEAATVAADVPVVVDLGADGLLAVLGPSDALDTCAGWITAQLATLHSPVDVVLLAALADADTAQWWRWLPHLPRDWPAAPVATDRLGAEALLRTVVELAAARRQERTRREIGAGPVVVLVLDDRLGPDPALVRAAAEGRDAGVAVVWLGTDARSVPTAAPNLLDLGHAPGTAELVTHRGAGRLTLVPEGVARAEALELSTCLAPVRDAVDTRRARSVPDQVSLEQLLPEVASPVALRRRWETAPDTRLVALLGVSADGPVELDLGPEGSHALVGGTTGSGKSELLQTLVTAVAAAYPPSRVGFLLVDYKGGAAFKDAMHLPHCVGVVTDLDAHLTRRVLRALDAEIRRREGLLAGGGARDLTELRRTRPQQAPGDLVIVVDEFSTLAKEIPEFVEGVVDLAARGRSLGLRLVLATQRPAGVVNDRIRANVGVRIALRVNDEADSLDVIGDRAAAHIPRTQPGRCFLKLHRELTEFQSAFVGGSLRGSTSAPIEVRDLDATSGPEAPTAVAGRTVLEAVVAASDQVARLGQWPRPHVPWLPALPEVVAVAGLALAAPSLAPAAVHLGLADVPDQQAQPVVALDLQQHQSLLVFGTSRSGKTTVLRTVAAGLIERLPPEELQLYALDFAGHGLQPFEAAPQCLGVVGPGEPGRIARLLRRLGDEVERRNRLLAGRGPADAALPRVVVLLDGWAGAASALERVDGGRLLERLERLVPDGPAVGVHFVITADRRAAVPSSLTSTITTRLVLRMAERDDYALLGVDQSLTRHVTLPPGRGFIQGTTEVQIAVRAGSDPDVEQRAVAALVQEAGRRWPRTARPVGRMPSEVALDELPRPPAPFCLPVGIGDADTLPVVVDLTEGHLVVAGPPRSGRSNALATIAGAAGRAEQPVATALVGGRRSAALTERSWDVGPVDPDDPAALARGLEDVRGLVDAGRPVLLLCDDADALSDAASTALEALLPLARDAPLRLVAAVDNRWALRAYSGIVPELRKSKQALLLAPEVELDGDLVGVRLRPPLEPATGPGRGFAVSRGAAELVQVALPDVRSPSPAPPPSAPAHEKRQAIP